MTEQERLQALETRVSELESQVAQLLQALGHAPSRPSPADTSAPANVHSERRSPEEKIALFMEYFAGRTDVYAVAKNTAGKKAWYPASNGYYDRRNPDLKPLTPKVIEGHLRRDNHFHVGLYPLCADDSCRLLCCDFDDDDFKQAACAYAEECKNHGLDPLIEVSRSGNGAHVWVFFDEPIPASLARSVGIGLLAKASPDSYFSSFDRFFPSQDTLPAKGRGFGNLIALPLAGHHRSEGTTVFVDSNFHPLPDQFEALARTKKSTLSELKRIYAALQPDPETSLPQAPTRAELKKLKASGKVHVTHDSHVHVDLSGVDATTRTALRHLGAIANPQFYIKQAQRFSTFGTPRIIVRFDEKDQVLTLDRGTLDDVIDILKTAGYTVTRRGRTPKPQRIDASFAGELRPYQHSAVKQMLKHKSGMLIAPPGTGKTVMACAIIAQRQVPTAVIVPSRELATQWRQALKQFLPDVQVGQYSGTKKKLSGEIDIVTAQSISRSDSKTDFLSSYGHIIVDECHRVGAAGLTNVLAHLNVRFMLGMTATPYRSDGLDKLLPLICGPIRHTVELERPGRRDYVVHNTEFTYDSPYLFWPDLDTALAADEDRNRLIADVITQAAQDEHTVLVLVKRREHLAALNALLTDAPFPVLQLHGGQKATERQAVREQIAATPHFVLLAMSQVAGEGIDLPALDTLVLAAPVSFRGVVIQQVGRVTRDTDDKESISATVHDFLDANVPALVSAFRKRSSTIAKQGFTRDNS
ncbi:DEAD/DEAH box helicase [Corynebacterium guaraldiae]|uniref:DEAD/DEAH box helicase n=1 Tax=Corynebacterium guaraldiae TaxID=3051103 RepID=UPI001177CEDA|nr:DEAD/DEAH box helicase [Corynebacterium guaraldiae]TRX41928.1 DEAD/DEAH box helicase [Corynebacterium guaraldiae]